MVTELGDAAVARGWRKLAADAVAPRFGASSLPLTEKQTRTLLGLGFLALTISHLTHTVRAGLVKSS
jgi:hypothetical protein